MHKLVSEQFVPVAIETVFAFFGQPANLGRLTPDWLGFRILTPAPVPMHTGALIDYQISLGPVPMHWRTMITAFDPPHRFVDEQLSGPYSFWHHTHSFEAVPGGTIIRDQVSYMLPLGPLGSLIHYLVVRRQLKAIFAYRERVMNEVFGEAKAQPRSQAQAVGQ